jgi:hypothetical protein
MTFFTFVIRERVATESCQGEHAREYPTPNLSHSNPPFLREVHARCRAGRWLAAKKGRPGAPASNFLGDNLTGHLGERPSTTRQAPVDPLLLDSGHVGRFLAA